MNEPLLPPVKVWIEDGRLLTNRPDVFANQFEIPDATPVDGLTRVSYRTKEIARQKRKETKP